MLDRYAALDPSLTKSVRRGFTNQFILGKTPFCGSSKSLVIAFVNFIGSSELSVGGGI